MKNISTKRIRIVFVSIFDLKCEGAVVDFEASITRIILLNRIMIDLFMQQNVKIKLDKLGNAL